MHTAAFRRFFPAVRLDPDVLYVDDGDVLTSAGNAAGIDLCLHLVRRDHGLAVANRVARRSVVSPWREGGQSQFVEPLADVAGRTRPRPARGRSTGSTEPLSLADLAAHAAMSVRTFTRRFRDETGVSPVRWLTDRRVELARRLLETTELPVDRVAQRAGFGTPTALRQQLHAAIGVAPVWTYRRTYRPGRPGGQLEVVALAADALVDVQQPGEAREERRGERRDEHRRPARSAMVKPMPGTARGDRARRAADALPKAPRWRRGRRRRR